MYTADLMPNVVRPMVEDLTLEEVEGGRECLVRALILLGLPERWTNNPMMRVPGGPLCIMDALSLAMPKGERLAHDAGDVAYSYLRQELNGVYPCVFNDNPDRTHDEVVLLFANTIWQCAVDERHLRRLRQYRFMFKVGVAITTLGLLMLAAIGVANFYPEFMRVWP